MNFLRLHVRQKALLLLFFLSFCFLSSFLDGSTKVFFAYISLFVMQNGVTRIRLLALNTQVNVFVKATLIVKFRMCEYDIPCAMCFRENSNGGLSTLITWSSKITWQTKTIIF